VKGFAIFNRLIWRLTLSYTLIALAAIFMVAWWGLVAVSLYLDRTNPGLTWIGILQERILPVFVIILPSILLLIIPAILISAYFGFLSARWLDMRLTNLNQATDAWQQGDFSVMVQDEQADEIGHFGQKLNRMAVELEHQMETRQALATLEERYRLARDLHDSVKQHMCAAALQLGAAQSLLNQDINAARQRITEAEHLAHTAQTELNTILLELRPPALERQGLVGSLRQYLVDWSRQSGIETDLRFQGEHSLSADIEEVIFRTVQEALANVARHSQAHRVIVGLVYEPGRLVLEIQDDGRGFDPAIAQDQGLGLMNMRERIEQAGGQFMLESTPSQGTKISAQLPG
jgi:signal transduction histidine kinase